VISGGLSTVGDKAKGGLSIVGDTAKGGFSATTGVLSSMGKLQS
jgi:hypothetical protein